MVMALLAKLLMTRQMKFEGGVIELKDIQMTLLPTFFVGELTDYFHEKNRLHELYLMAWLWGYVLVGQVTNRFKLQTPEQVYSLGMNLGEAMGIGLYKTHDYVAGRYTHFVIPNNPFLKYMKELKEKKPLDYFISGCMGGGGYFVHGAICQNVETKCVMAGDHTCEFLTGTEKELKDRGLWEEACNRYKLDLVYPLQKKFSDNYKDGNEAQLFEEILTEIKSL